MPTERAWTIVRSGPSDLVPIVAYMNEGDRIERRTERAVFETDRQLIVGDVTLPPEGYQSRFSDALNRPDLDFIPLTNVEITALDTGKVSERPFAVVAKAHIRISFPF
jgi:hypothetical protein